MPDSAPGKLTRQQIYDRIRESSKDEYILSEMIRLGFWDEGKGKPSVSAQLIADIGDSQRELRELLEKQQAYSDPEKALAELHKKRKAEAMQSREQTKKDNNDKRHQRALDWHNKNQQQITFLGDEYSDGLNGHFTDVERLTKQGLPVIDSAMALATAMGININELRFLSFGRKTSKTTHYQQFLIAKKTGGTRRISAPMPRLKRAQYWVLGNILEPLPLNDAAHGFVCERSIVTNAQPHVGKDVVINMDLKDFFPTVTYRRIKGVFVKLGYSEHVATILALLCSEPEIDEVSLDGETFFVARSERFLPQGAPTSPAISNLLCRNLDVRLSGISNKLEFSYTRYADDLTFSASKKAGRQLRKLLWRTEQIVTDEGFVIHPDKTRIMRHNNRQEVTGIVVNEKLSVDRKTLKRFRALLFQIEKDGIDGKSWGEGAIIPSIEGYANFVAMVDAPKGLALQKRVTLIKEQLGYQVKPGRIGALNRQLMRAAAIKGMAATEDWWQAKAPALPEKEVTPVEQVEQKKVAKTHSSRPKTQTPDMTFDEPGLIERLHSQLVKLIWIVFAVLLAMLLDYLG